MSKWNGEYSTSEYAKSDSLEQDILNNINYGVVYARPLPSGGTEVLEERDGSSRLNVYFPNGNGGHTHDYYDTDEGYRHVHD